MERLEDNGYLKFNREHKMTKDPLLYEVPSRRLPT